MLWRNKIDFLLTQNCEFLSKNLMYILEDLRNFIGVFFSTFNGVWTDLICFSSALDGIKALVFHKLRGNTLLNDTPKVMKTAFEVLEQDT